MRSDYEGFYEDDTPRGRLWIGVYEDACGPAFLVELDGKPQGDGSCSMYRLTPRQRASGRWPKGTEMVMGSQCFGAGRADAIEAALDRHRAGRAERLAALAARAEPDGYLYAMGCDGPSTFHLLFDSDSDPGDEVRRRIAPRYEPIERLTADDFRRVAEETGALAVAATMATYGGWRFDRAGLSRLLDLATARDERREAATARREAALRSMAVPAAALAAYARYEGDPDRAWDEEDEGSWSLIRSYAEAIEEQGLSPAVSGRKFARERAGMARESAVPGEG